MKYHNKKLSTPDGKFDSKYEYEVWCSLKILEKAKVISDLQRQVGFDLIPALKTSEGTLRGIKYYADFTYTQDGVKYAVDTKGFETDVYKIKKRLFVLNYPDILFIERKKNKKDKIYKKIY